MIKPEAMIELLEKAKAGAQEFDLDCVLITIPLLDMIVELLKGKTKTAGDNEIPLKW